MGNFHDPILDVGCYQHRLGPIISLESSSTSVDVENNPGNKNSFVLAGSTGEIFTVGGSWEGWRFTLGS